MKKNYKVSFSVLAAIVFSTSLFAQNNFFTDAGENRMMQTSGLRVIIPQKFRASQLNVPSIKNFLWSLPSEKNIMNRSQAPIITLPMPNGEMAKFRVWESSIQEPGLEAKFPEIKTFTGQGIDDPYATIRLDLGPNGFHAQVLTVNGSFYIDPYAKGSLNNYISYYRTDLRKSGTWICEVPENPGTYRTENPQASCLGTNLKTYRLAVACTGEYAQAPGINAGSNPAILHAAIVTSVNRVVGVYEKEVAIRLVLVATNNLVEFLDAATDPFTGNNSASILINESQTVIDGNIGSANYDIGHTFSTGGGGLAQLRCPCGPSKARGITGSSSPTGDGYDIDYVAHEMGHQFGGNHSFNGQVSNCSGGNRNGSTAYEPGSGTTIQGYAGICGTDNIQSNSDPYFHPVSFDEISDFVLSGAGSTCGTTTPTGNNLPVIAALPNNGVTIPARTPFTLTGSATDPDGDPLTYSWEQWDLGPQGAWNSGATSTTAPNFKSRIPKVTGSRTFPDIAVILAGYPVNPSATMGGLKGETLPTVDRAMKFRLTVRDNRAGGGGVVSSGTSGCQTSSVYQINVVGSTPFSVSTPNGGESLTGGIAQTITWNTAGTEGAPYNVTNVRILLSTDNGNTYPTEIIATTPNDGSESVIIPSVVTSTARIKIEAIGNIFFDISNANFSIIPPPAGFDFTSPAPVVSSCPAPATMSITLGTTFTGGFSTPINLTATSGVPAGTSVTFGTNPVTPGNSSIVSLNNTNTLSAGSYIITITGVAGSITKTRDLTYTINPGAGPVITAQPATQTICAGSDVTFSVTATGTYQWQVSTNSGGTWTNVTGQTSSSYTITAVNADLNGNQYRCIVTGLCGITNSNAAILTVNTAPAITGQPEDVTLCIGTNNTFSVSATGVGISYQWQVSTDGGVNYNNISGANSSSYSLTGITAGMNGNRYRAVISGGCPPSPLNSNGAVLTVISPVTILSSPVNSLLCSGSNTNFAVSGSSTQAIIYQWQENSGSGFTNVSNGGVYSGVTSATLTITGATTLMNGYQYRCLLSNATCTTPAISGIATLTVRQLPTVSLAAAPFITLLPGQTTTLTASPSSATGGVLTTNWLFNNVAISNPGNTRIINVEEVGNYQVTIQEVFSSPSIVCSNQSAVITIDATVSNKLFIFPSPNDGNFTVSYYNNGGTSTQRAIVIFDSKGNQVYNRKFSIVGAYTLIPINLERVNRGIFYVVVGDNSGKKLAEGKVHVR